MTAFPVQIGPTCFLVEREPREGDKIKAGDGTHVVEKAERDPEDGGWIAYTRLERPRREVRR